MNVQQGQTSVLRFVLTLWALTLAAAGLDIGRATMDVLAQVSICIVV